MANQITINIGAVANDGTGDPLRTAFNDVNLNFANVWATGLPNSNIQFNNNRILTVNTNANLILAPNGVGVVQSNVSILPNTDRVHDLGSAGKKWNSVYAHYLNIDNFDLAGDLTVGGNLTVEGDTIQIGNIVTDTKTIQLSNTAASAAAANGSGITVGANDNIATFTYNSLSNSWVTNLAVTYSNGQPVGGQPGGSNSQVQFNGNGVFAGNVNFTFNNVSGDLQTPGNIVPSANIQHNLGGTGRRWSNVYTNQILASGLISTTGNIIATGDITANNATIGNITTSENLYANVGTFYGDQYGDGAIYVGTPAGTVLGSDVVMQVTANSAGYSQINFQNINSGNGASGDYIITGDLGNDSTYYLDLGLASSNHADPGFFGDTSSANDGYLYVTATDQAGPSVGVGNLILGSTNGVIKLFVGNTAQANVIATVDSNGLNMAAPIIGDGNLYLQPDPANAGSYLDIYLTGGPDIHIAGNDNSIVIGRDTGANIFVGNDGEVSIQANTGTAHVWTFDSAGQTVFPVLNTQRGDNPSGTISGFTLNGSDGSQEFIITTPDGVVGNEYSQRLVINPGAGNNFGEGGDIYLWAGRGGNGSGSGGDIKIRGGQGGANTQGGSGGSGGYIRIEAGDAASVGGGAAGYIDITGGFSNITGGYVRIQGGGGNAGGGDANITGGYGYGGPGGNVNILGGSSALGAESYGNVIINTGNMGNTWTFDRNGNLTITYGSQIQEVASPVPGNYALALRGTGTVSPDQQLLVYPTSFDANHLHLTSGNLYNTELFLGNDNLYVKLANTGNIVINSDDDVGNTGQWTFGTDGNTTFPTGSKISNGYPGLAQDGSSWVVTPSGGSGGLVSADGEQYIQIGNNSDIYIGTGWPGNNREWTFGRNGNLTTPGNIVTASGVGGNISGANVITANTFSATGNITGGNLIATANVLGSGYARFAGTFDESQASTAGLYLGYAGGTPRMMFGTGNTSQTLEIDNDGGTLRFYKPGTTLASLNTSGDFSAAGNITGNTAGYAIGYRDIPQVTFNANATTALTDAGKHYYSVSASNLVLTIANNSSVVWPVGTAISIVNRGTANITVAGDTGVSLYLAGNSTAGDRTVTTYGMATVMNVAANIWMISGTVV